MNASILSGQPLPGHCRDTARRRRLAIANAALLLASLASSANAQHDVMRKPGTATAPIQATSFAHASANPVAPANNRKTRTPQQKHPPQAHPHPPQSALSRARPGTSTPLAHKAPHVYTAAHAIPQVHPTPGPLHGATRATIAHPTTSRGAQSTSPGAKQSLNPQPIPPGRPAHAIAPSAAPPKPIQH